MVVIFALQAYFTRKAGENTMMYTSPTDCNTILEMFDYDYKDPKFMLYAAKDKEPTLAGEGIGMYVCYCVGFKTVDNFTYSDEVSFCD